MTAVCGGGTSAPKTGSAAVVDYGAGLLAAIFGAYDLVWLIPIIPFVGLAPLALSTFCATDPPSVTALTTAESEALLQLQFGSDFDSGLTKVKDMVLRMLWYENCMCTSGSAPSAITLPAPPTNAPITQQPAGSLPPACDRHVLNNNTVGATGTGQMDGASGLLFTLPEALRATVTFHAGQYSASGASNIRLQVGTSCNATIFDQPLVNISGDVWQMQCQIPALLHCGGSETWRWQVVGTFAHTTAVATYDVLIEFFCGITLGADGGQAPCVTDPTVLASLDNILSLVTLIQRQIVPFATIGGAAHTGLTGQGTISFDGLVGVKIMVTTLPGYVGLISGDPDELFDVGWFAWGNADGFAPREFISHSPQLSTPPRGSVYTTLGYSLNPDVVVTISEISREP